MAGTADIVMPMEQEGSKSVVRAWLKHVGDAVKRDEPIVELETDKVAVEVPAFQTATRWVQNPGVRMPPVMLMAGVEPLPLNIWKFHPALSFSRWKNPQPWKFPVECRLKRGTRPSGLRSSSEGLTHASTVKDWVAAGLSEAL